MQPYLINFSDDADKTPFQVQPSIIDVTTTSLSLPGKGHTNYGELYNENLVHLLENFSKPIAPLFPTRGQLWYNTANRSLNVYDLGHPMKDGAGWVRLATAPDESRIRIPSFAGIIPSPALGDVWYNTIDNTICYYDGGAVIPQVIASQDWVDNNNIDGGTEVFV